MPVFACSGCGATLQVGDEHAGKNVQCPTCKTTTVVPSPGAITAEPPHPPATAAPDPASVTATSPGAPPPIAPDAEQPKRRRRAETDDDEGDDDDDRPRRRPRAPAKAAAGMSGCVIALIVCGVMALLAIPCGLALLIPAVQKVREAAARTHTMNNMKQIALAQHSHHDVYRSFATPKHHNDFGKQVDLSWRFSVLPYIEQDNIFRAMDRNSAWDSPGNRQLGAASIPVYLDPFRDSGKFDPTATRFQVFTGPNTLFPDNTKRGMNEVHDGTSNTLLFAEGQTPVSPWSRPLDMNIQPGGPLPLPPDQFLAAMCDGSVRSIDRRRTSDATLRLAIDPRDGQVLPGDF